MTTGKQKLNVGPLPEQVDDYNQYEESELRWDRILIAGLALLFLIFLLVYWLVSDKQASSEIVADASKGTENSSMVEKEASAEDVKVADVERSDSRQNAVKIIPFENLPSIAETLNIASPARNEETVEKTEVSRTMPVVSLPEAKEISTDDHLTAVSGNIIPEQASADPAKPEPPVVKVFDIRIQHAQLSSNIIKGSPVDDLGGVVRMSEEGIIKVHLYTVMEGLRGQFLFHDWYRNGQKQARVKIPVNVDPQRSSSSKFINRQMLGDWTVKVLDRDNNLFLEAGFEVVAP